MAILSKKKSFNRVPDRGEVSFKRQLLRGFLRLSVVAILLWSTYYVTRLPAFVIGTVDIVGGETISHDEIRTQVLNELKGNYLLIVPKHFTYLYPHDRIQEVVEGIPSIYDVSVTRTSHQALAISFKEYVPFSLWCGEQYDVQPCYFINENGYAFMEAPVLKGGSFIRHSVEGMVENHEGQVIDSATLKELSTFINRMNSELGLRISVVKHKRNRDYEFVINGGGAVLVASDKLNDTTFDNLKAILDSKEFKHLEPGNFRYIDVRFENKIFVNESLDIATTTATTTVQNASSTLPE